MPRFSVTVVRTVYEYVIMEITAADEHEARRRANAMPPDALCWETDLETITDGDATDVDLISDDD